MSSKFPTPSTYTAEKVSKTRFAVLANGEYVCQLKPAEVSSWLFKANRDSVKFAQDEAAMTIRRIEIALEYLAARALRDSAVFARNQFNLF